MSWRQLDTRMQLSRLLVITGVETKEPGVKKGNRPWKKMFGACVHNAVQIDVLQIETCGYRPLSIKH